jgi:hypothetical protein
MIKVFANTILLLIRWNSTHDMIGRFLYLKPALLSLFAFSEHYELTPFILNKEEWGLLEEIHGVLDIFVNPTKHLSGSKYSTLQLQLPYYSLLLKQLGNFVHIADSDPGRSDIISSAYDRAWEVLNRYWCKTDQDTALAIAMILDPRCKLDGLERLGFSAPIRRQSKTHFLRIYRKHYRAPEPTDENRSRHPEEGGVPNPLAKLFGYGSTGGFQGNSAEKEETDRWLDEPAEGWQTEPAAWWSLYDHRYPKGLCRMARDYLAVPASSVPAERLFSRAGDVVTQKRNRLLDTATKHILLVENWIGQPDYELWELTDEKRAKYDEDTDLGSDQEI